MVVLIVLCLGVYFFLCVLLMPYVCFHWPPIGKIAAYSAYDMFHGIIT